MADPFLGAENGGNLLELEVQRLRQENRELRLNNTNLRARLAMATPAASAVASSTHHDRSPEDSIPSAKSAHAKTGTAAVGSSAVSTSGESTHDGRGEPASQRGRRKGSTAGSANDEEAGKTASAAAGAAASKAQQAAAVRLREAAQKITDLQKEAERRAQTLEAAKADTEQLKREFELFVSTTCEREAAYQLVYTQVYRELEEQKGLVQSAQTQLEEQRVQSLKMRQRLEAAVAAAAAGHASGAAGSSVMATANAGAVHGAVAVAATPPSSSGSVVVAESADGENGQPAVKKPRVLSEAQKRARRGGKGLPKDIDWGMLVSGGSAPSHVTAQDTSAEVAEDGKAESAIAPSELSGPRALKILTGGAGLRSARKMQPTKRSRDGAGAVDLRQPLSAVGAGALLYSAAVSSTALHAPVAPVFASTPSKPTNESWGSSPSITTQGTGFRATRMAATASRHVSAASDASSTAAMEALWQLMTHHTEATHGFLPLWQHLAVLRGADRYRTLSTLVQLLLHLLEQPEVPFKAASVTSTAATAPLPPSFTSQPSSLSVVATAIRLLAVQLEETTQQQRGSALVPQRTDADAHHRSAALLSSLFYRVCVVALRRWQQVTEVASEALEQWSTAMQHLYGFQLPLLRLMQYTNATAAYQRTRLPHGWVSYTAQSIFAQCMMASPATATASSSAEGSVQRWRDLCDSIGWSAHALPLDKVETAAARCVATSRAGGPGSNGIGGFSAACAEEALLSLRLVVLYKGFDRMERVAKLLEQPGVLPMMLTKEIYAELVSLALRDRVPFRTRDARHHAVKLLTEYMQEVAPERCTSAEHFVMSPRRSHVLAALALLQVGESDPADKEGDAGQASAEDAVMKEGRRVTLQWLQAQKVALEMIRKSPTLAADRPLLLRDTPLGQSLLRKADA